MKNFTLVLAAMTLVSIGISKTSFAEVYVGLCSQSPSNGHYDSCTNSEASCLAKAEEDANFTAQVRCRPGTANAIVVERKRSQIMDGVGTSWWDCQVQVRYTCSH